MRTFESLTEQEVLALAISIEEEDARIYDDFADGLKDHYPEQASKFKANQSAHTMTEKSERLVEIGDERPGSCVDQGGKLAEWSLAHPRSSSR